MGYSQSVDPTFCTSNVPGFRCGRGGRCCRGWDILFSKEVVSRIQNAPKGTFPALNKNKEPFQVVNPDNPLYYATVTIEDTRCIFLEQDGTCQVFNHFGKEQGNPICLSYPFVKMQLQGRIGVSSSIACTSEQKSLFVEKAVTLVSLPDDHESKSWYLLDFSILERICFHDALFLPWQTFYQVETALVSLAGRETRLWTLLKSWNALYQKIWEQEQPPSNLSSWIEDQGAGDHPVQADFLPLIKLFVQRKINLYHNPQFQQAVTLIFEIREPDFQNTFSGAFMEVLRPSEPILCRYLAIKLFSNTGNFMKSMAFCWHELWWQLGFILTYAYSRWKSGETLSPAILQDGITLVERHFFHDSRIFQLWGQGRRGRKEFHPDSLGSCLGLRNH